MSSGPPPSGRRRNPWWIPPFLGRVPPEVPDRHVGLLGALAVAVCFENYDQAMLTQAIRQIAADYGLIEAQLGTLLGVVRLGAIPAFLLVPYADRVGRRRLFLVSVIGMSVATASAALAPEVVSFAVLQMLARTFMVTSAATAYVIVTEEFPSAHRGWGIGTLGAIGALGVGLSALLFAAIDVLPFGWRAMYVFGATPLLLLPRLRVGVVETRRFREEHRERAARGDARGEAWWVPLARLARHHPVRTALVGLIGATSSAGTAAGYNFSAYFVQEVHGWAPAQYSLMLLVAGAAGVLGHPVAGRLADRRGRRLVGFLFYAAFPLLAVAFYRGPGWMLPVVWVPMVFTLTGGTTIARALSTELFPTAYRGTSSGWLQLVDTLGSAAGLFVVSLATSAASSAMDAVQGVVFVTLVAALSVLALPETGSRELEDISATP